MFKEMNFWKGTAGLRSGMPLISSTSSNFLMAIGTGTSAIPPDIEEITRKGLGIIPYSDLVRDERFQFVTQQYQRGELTLGEASEQLGMNRYDYESELKRRGIVLIPQERSDDELINAQRLLMQQH